MKTPEAQIALCLIVIKVHNFRSLNVFQNLAISIVLSLFHNKGLVLDYFYSLNILYSPKISHWAGDAIPVGMARPFEQSSNENLSFRCASQSATSFLLTKDAEACDLLELWKMAHRFELCSNLNFTGDDAIPVGMAHRGRFELPTP